MFHAVTYDSPLGKLTIASDARNIVGLRNEGQKNFESTLRGEEEDGANLPVLRAACGWLDRYFAGGRPLPSELPLAPQGRAFRLRVWKELCAIPCGTVTSYGRMAERLGAEGRGTSARAVGGAVGHNPISIIIPCHRVVGARGDLTGYAGGMEKKRFLLHLEGVEDPRPF